MEQETIELGQHSAVLFDYNEIVHSREAIPRRICGRQVSCPAHRLSYPAKVRERDSKARWGLHPRAASCAGGGVKQAQAGATRHMVL